MRRILFQWLGIRIYTYPAMLYLGVVFGVIGGTYTAALHGLDPTRVYSAMLLLLLPTLVGARLLFVASHWEVYRREPSRIWRRSEGGAALYGGLLASFLFSLPLLAALGISVAGFWDAAAIAMLIGMVLTRFGCLLNGCCAGRPTDGALALHLPNEQGVWYRRVPAQPLEAGLAVLLLVISITARSRFPFDGVLFLTALAGYGLGRWWLESTRETIDRVGSLSLHRSISASLVALSTVGLLLIWLYKT
jgi:phosphatidylglycerol---prolipoprotein diacylglyceryl transferase